LTGVVAWVGDPVPKLRLPQATMAKRDTRLSDLCQELRVTRQTPYRFATR
jgi:hypothetical protein